jgi:hypothetical protein
MNKGALMPLGRAPSTQDGACIGCRIREHSGIRPRPALAALALAPPIPTGRGRY